MQYMGSKNRLSKKLAPIIQQYVDQPQCNGYLEPFVGGANMIDKIKCDKKFGSDIHKYLIALLKQAQNDISIFPKTVTYDEYQKVKNNKNNYEDWYVGLVGFCASFGAKWFGGYARRMKADKITPCDVPHEAITSLIKQSSALKGITFKYCDFRDINKVKNFVIYCDIPYRGTTKYATSEFPYEYFYKWCKEMSEHNVVLISEYNMPEDFKCIWSKEVKCVLDKNSVSDKIEKLFIYNRGV